MRAPELAVGDGALGFWAAIRDVFPESRHLRDWVHKTRNVLDAMPKSVHSRAKRAIRDNRGGEQGRSQKSRGGFLRGVRDEVAQGGQEDKRRRTSLARLLRLCGRALDPPSEDQPHRVSVRRR